MSVTCPREEWFEPASLWKSIWQFCNHLKVSWRALCMEGADSVFGTHLGVIGTVPGTSGWDFQKQQQEQRDV